MMMAFQAAQVQQALQALAAAMAATTQERVPDATTVVVLAFGAAKCGAQVEVMVEAALGQREYRGTHHRLVQNNQVR